MAVVVVPAPGRAGRRRAPRTARRAGGRPRSRAAAAAVERVGAQHGIAHGDQAGGDRLAVDDVVAPPVEQAGHHVHVGVIGSARPSSHGRGDHERARGVVEQLRVGQALRSSSSASGVASVIENVPLSPANTPYFR